MVQFSEGLSVDLQVRKFTPRVFHDIVFLILELGHIFSEYVANEVELAVSLYKQVLGFLLRILDLLLLLL